MPSSCDPDSAATGRLVNRQFRLLCDLCNVIAEAPTASHAFFSTASAPFFFLLLSPFLFLRSLLRKLSIVALHTSAYRVKKASRSSGCTTVLMLTWSLFFTRSFDCVSPSDARTITGSGSVGWRSDSGSPGTLSDGDLAVWSYVTTLVRHGFGRAICDRTYGAFGSGRRIRGLFVASSPSSW